MQTWMDPGIAHPQEDELPVLLVEVHGVRCGLPAADVVELHPVVALTDLPGAPAVVEGVIDVRGTAVAVLDLRARLGLTRRPARPSDQLVLVRVLDRTLALRADRVLDLVDVPVAAVEPSLSSRDTAGLRGVARLDDGLLLIHDVEAFLSDDEMATLADAMSDLGDRGRDEP